MIRSRGASFLIEAALLAAGLAVPWLPVPWAAAALLILTVLWVLLFRPPRREVVFAGGAALLATLALAAPAWLERRMNPLSGPEVATLRAEYRQLWEALAQEAAAGARAFPDTPDDGLERLAAFRRLAEVHSREAPRDLRRFGQVFPAKGRSRGAEAAQRALLLLDPDGAAVAWAGDGLLHELAPEVVPRDGRHYVAGFSAVTLFEVRPLSAARRPWRVVAGVSFPSDRLPFGASPPVRWSLAGDLRQAAAGALAVQLRGTPALVLDRGSAASSPAPLSPRRLAWVIVGAACLGLAVMRGLGWALSAKGSGLPANRSFLLPVLGGALAWALAGQVSLPALGLLIAGWALAGLGLSGRGIPGAREVGGLALRGAAGSAVLIAAGTLLQWQGQPLDLAAGILTDAEGFWIRLALAAAAFGAYSLAGLRRDDSVPRPPGGYDRWAWSAAGLFLIAGALSGFPWVSGALLLAAGGATAVWADRRHLLRPGMALFVLALLAGLGAAGAAEVGYRLRLQEYVDRELLPRFAPPSPAAVQELGEELRRHFAGFDLERLAPRSPQGLKPQDLAFALWRDSPLARRNALSALVVQPLPPAVATLPSTFSFGMPLGSDGRIDWSPSRWEGVSLSLWEGGLIQDEVTLTYAGRPWATARYWLLPRPGFVAGDRERLEEVEVGLLRGGPVTSPVAGLPDATLYALYDAKGRSLLSPWEESPPLSAVLQERGEGTVETPWGRMRASARPFPGPPSSPPAGWSAAYLKPQTPLQGLERMGNQAVGVLSVLAAAALLTLLFALPRTAFRNLLRRAVRSYSKRLLLVYTALLLLPLLLLNTLLLRVMGERLALQQRAAGEAALNSAQKTMGELLFNLGTGVGIDTAMSDTRLATLSDVVHHEVNFYWGSTVYGSSKHELFTAGLLPNRIPGDIFARLALGGYDLSSRVNRVGGTEYLELYAPLRVPGESQAEERLFLSIPLLAQQEEAAQELLHLRRHGLLVTVALVLLLGAVGTRLAQNFTRPLQDLVEGTRRIAAGAPSLDLAPSELELAALVEAVDQMARKISEGREKLVREKQVVERVVENITAGVVSLDRGRRVLMLNRVAAELLGVEMGESLERRVGAEPRLAAVAEFLRAIGTGQEMARETVRLADSTAAEDAGTGGDKEWTLVWVPLPGEGEPAALLVVEDATEVLRGQRLLAWAEMARIIAHEIKNPLTPIRLSAEHMREVYRHDAERFAPVFERCTHNILAQVEELRSIASDFSTYSALLRIDPQPGNLTAAIAEVAEAYRAAPPEGITVELETPGPIPARFDAKLLGRAVRNLLENALRASAGGGKVVVRVERLGSQARIAVLDSGPGVPAELLHRIFDPYFSTHDTGTGLGLPIARRVAEEHGGTITARNRAEGGLEVALTLPVEEPA